MAMSSDLSSLFVSNDLSTYWSATMLPLHEVTLTPCSMHFDGTSSPTSAELTEGAVFTTDDLEVLSDLLGLHAVTPSSYSDASTAQDTEDSRSSAASDCLAAPSSKCSARGGAAFERRGRKRSRQAGVYRVADVTASAPKSQQQRQKLEIVSLREQVVELEATIQQLQARKRERERQAEGNALQGDEEARETVELGSSRKQDRWEGVAKQQVSAVERLEEQNETLRQHVARHLEELKKLEQLAWNRHTTATKRQRAMKTENDTADPGALVRTMEDVGSDDAQEQQEPLAAPAAGDDESVPWTVRIHDKRRKAFRFQTASDILLLREVVNRTPWSCSHGETGPAWVAVAEAFKTAVPWASADGRACRRRYLALAEAYRTDKLHTLRGASTPDMYTEREQLLAYCNLPIGSMGDATDTAANASSDLSGSDAGTPSRASSNKRPRGGDDLSSFAAFRESRTISFSDPRVLLRQRELQLEERRMKLEEQRFQHQREMSEKQMQMMAAQTNVLLKLAEKLVNIQPSA
ncbi:hypothetical protein BBJ28_00014656 [Nothophytophthora sp. Chile5]|nr:hypothetical protein BBJ28_00014656 [Nothophytophthora sp. Chile5]